MVSWALPVVKGRKLIKRNRWPSIGGIHDIRPCQYPDDLGYCGALVFGDEGQTAHVDWHNELADKVLGEEVKPVKGYIVGDKRTEETIDHYAEENER